MTKSEPIPSADKSVNYNDFMTSRINSNYSFVKTEKIESGIAQTSLAWSSTYNSYGSGWLGEQFGEFWIGLILVGEPNFILVKTNEYFANPNKFWRTEIRLGKLHFELCE